MDTASSGYSDIDLLWPDGFSLSACLEHTLISFNNSYGNQNIEYNFNRYNMFVNIACTHLITINKNVLKSIQLLGNGYVINEVSYCLELIITMLFTLLNLSVNIYKKFKTEMALDKDGGVFVYFH